MEAEQKKVWVVQSGNDTVEAVCATKEIAEAIAKQVGGFKVFEIEFEERIPDWVRHGH
jgi:hypothetical protein